MSTLQLIKGKQQEISLHEKIAQLMARLTEHNKKHCLELIGKPRCTRIILGKQCNCAITVRTVLLRWDAPRFSEILPGPYPISILSHLGLAQK